MVFSINKGTNIVWHWNGDKNKDDFMSLYKGDTLIEF